MKDEGEEIERSQHGFKMKKRRKGAVNKSKQQRVQRIIAWV
jgi:hypothetical protein